MQRDYTLAFKLSAIDQVEKGEASYREARKRNGIRRHSRSCGFASMTAPELGFGIISTSHA